MNFFIRQEKNEKTIRSRVMSEFSSMLNSGQDYAEEDYFRAIDALTNLKTGKATLAQTIEELELLEASETFYDLAQVFESVISEIKVELEKHTENTKADLPSAFFTII